MTSALPQRPPRRPRWEGRYARLLAGLDLVLVLAAFALAQLLRLKDPGSSVLLGGAGSTTKLHYALLVPVLAAAWVLILGSSRCYEARLLGVGSEEFKRVGEGSVRFLAVLGLAAFGTRTQLARGFVAIAVPLGFGLLLLGRYGARRVLHGLRRRNRCLHRVVVVGDAKEVVALAEQIAREPFAGLHVVAVALPESDGSTDVMFDDEPLINIGPARDLAARLVPLRIDTVAVAGSSSMSQRELRQLSWDLEGTGSDLVVAPAITDVTGPRIHVRPVAGLPLLHLEAPSFGGVRQGVKRAIDVVGSLLLILVLALPLAVISLLVRREDHGPVLYRQERVGKDSSRFHILKFRSMRVGAHQELAGLENESDGPLFKVRDDPRVTQIGRVLRRHSLDELPQLFNVLRGTMSLVGPRPPLPSEVDDYDDHVHRRLLVKPGMTGLWQVSGRADLPWEETVRLDLYYVENWSVALDAQILWKTMFAVFRGNGAY